MRVGSLFSGVGGFDLGLERAGHRVVWQVEKDKQCRSVLRRHWPDVDLYEDVCDVGSQDVNRGYGQAGQPATRHRDGRSNSGNTGRGGTRYTLAPVDLICGGFPCQDVSVAGRHQGLAGERSGLWGEFHRIIGELAPAWVLIENVPGLLSSNDGRDMAVIVRGLEELGYGWSYRVLDSQFFGVAQRRRRVFIVGRLGGFCPPEILLEPEGVFGDTAPSREAREEVAGSIGGGSIGSERGFRKDLGGHGAYPLQPGPAYTLRSRDHKGPSVGRDGMAGNIVAHTYRKATKQPDYDRWEDTEVSGTLVRHDLGSDTRTSEVVLEPILGDGRPGRGTLKAGRNTEVYGAAVPRRLTPAECSRLQAFPDDWTEWGMDEDGKRVDLADGPRYRMMGNAVTVNVAEWIGRRIS